MLTFIKILPVRSELLQTYREMDRQTHDESHSRLSQFSERA